MNQVTEEQKQTLTKVFAIVGFIAIIIIAVFVAVNIVRLVPSAFSSLASIADSVANYSARREQLEVASGNSVVNAGESVTISWTKMRQNGSYSFSYACTDGVAIEAKDTDGKIVTLACNTPLQLGSNTSVDLMVSSEKTRFVDVSYTVTFVPEKSGASSVSTTKSLTIVNASIPASGKPVVTTATSTSVTGTKTTPSTPSKTTGYKPGTPVTIHKVIYTMPVSDPNGTIDLQVTYIGVGIMQGTTFIPTANIVSGEEGAVRFAIKNIGTKTASAWSYHADLPAGLGYDSGAQIALKPNEQAILTLSFNGVDQRGVQTFGVDVSAQNDVNRNNNTFSWSVNVK